MLRILPLLLAFICATANAEVFRRLGPDGNFYFSDRPGPDAEQIDVTPAAVIRPPPVRERPDTAGEQDSATPLYAKFNILSPTSDEGVRANNGNVTIRLSLQPALVSGHTIVLKVDGEDGKSINTGDGMAIELLNLSRGRHSVEATVIDDEGSELIQAGPVGFWVLRVAVGGR